MHLFGVNQQDGASDIAGFGKVFLGALPDIHDGNVMWGASAGAQAIETARSTNCSGATTVIRVAPSAHDAWIEKFSV